MITFESILTIRIGPPGWVPATETEVPRCGVVGKEHYKRVVSFGL